MINKPYKNYLDKNSDIKPKRNVDSLGDGLKLMEKISTGLKELGIQHGHLHEGNFVLLFKRKENDKVDFSIPPRVYVIDFDAAKSP